MEYLLLQLAYLLTMIAKPLEPGGARIIVAERPLIKRQLQARLPNLTALDFSRVSAHSCHRPDSVDACVISLEWQRSALLSQIREINQVP